MTCEGIDVATVAISGYYGFGNAGDEAVLSGIVGSFANRCPKADLVVLSADPAATQEMHGVRAVHRTNPIEVISTLRQADLLISGGGSLLQDVTSGASIMYYLGIIWLAKRLGKKVMIYAQGIGPIEKRCSRRVARSILNQVDLISVRDTASADYLRTLRIRRPRTEVTADPSFAIEPVPDEEAREILTAAGAPEGVPLVGVALRPWEEHPNWMPAIARGLESAAASIGAGLVFIPMQPDQDKPVAVHVASEMKARSAVISGRLSPTQTLGIIGQMSLVVGMRLHALIFAASMGVPFVGISYDPKVDAFVRETAGRDPLRLAELTPSEVAARVSEMWDNKDEMIEAVRERVREHRAAALANAELACDLIHPRGTLM